MSRPSLLLVEPHPHTRLDRVARLGARFTVHTLAPGEEPVRRVRRDRVDLVLLALPRGTAAMEAALRTARVLKTDRRPPRLGLTDRWGRLGDAAAAGAVLARIGAEGYLAGRVADAALFDFLAALAGPGPTIVQGQLERGLLARVFGRS